VETMIKKIIMIVRKICFGFLFLYGINMILSSVNIFIPINIPTVATVSLLGTPGFLSLLAMYYIIK